MNEVAKRPFFTVIISTFNRADLLKRALESLISQSEHDWEVIIIDDGSTDDTINILREYRRSIPDVKYLYHENKGAGLSKSDGIVLAKGRYITFLDSDDEYERDHLLKKKKYLENNPGIDVLHGGVKIIGDPYVPDLKTGKGRIHLDECVIGGTFFVKKQAFIKTSGYSEARFGDDLEFFNKAKKAGLLIASSPLKTYIYHRDSKDSLCSKYNKS